MSARFTQHEARAVAWAFLGGHPLDDRRPRRHVWRYDRRIGQWVCRCGAEEELL